MKLPEFASSASSVYAELWPRFWPCDDLEGQQNLSWAPIGSVPICVQICTMGRPLKGRNIPGCSAVISRRLHFRVLYGINQFQNQFSRIWNRFKPESSGIFSTLLWKPVWKPVSFIWNRFIPESTRKCRWSEMAPEHPRMFLTLERFFSLNF